LINSLFHLQFSNKMKKKIGIVGEFRIPYEQVYKIVTAQFGPEYEIELNLNYFAIKKEFGGGVISRNTVGVINGAVPHKTRNGLVFSGDERVIPLEQSDEIIYIPFESTITSSGELKGTVDSLQEAIMRLKKRIDLLESGQPDSVEELAIKYEKLEPVLIELIADEDSLTFIFGDPFKELFPKRQKKVKKTKSSKKNKRKSRR
jgi:hypothetical protein